MISTAWRGPNRFLGGDAVEVRFCMGMVEVRDRSGAITAYAPSKWQEFVDAVKNGEYDLPDGVAA